MKIRHSIRLHVPFVLLLALATVSPFVGCSTNQPPTTQINDTAIATKVKAKLTGDPEVNPFNVDVDVDEGVVRLSGTVEDEATRDEAAKIARNTHGVVRVDNDLEIGERGIGDRLDDAAITAKVKARLAGNGSINPFNINVDTEDGVVTLMGRVADESHKETAERVARDTQGVKEVHNRLKVGETEAG